MSGDPDQSPKPEAGPKQRYATGLIQRRVEMPLGLWNEVLEISKAGGIDHRDAILQLLDLGLQAADEGALKPRIVAVDKSVWDMVDAASFKGATDEQALSFLVDLGLQAHSRTSHTKELVPAGSIRVRLDSLGPAGGLEHLGQILLPGGALPARGDVVTWRGKHYEVEQRAWALAGPIVYLRVKAYGDTK